MLVTKEKTGQEEYLNSEFASTISMGTLPLSLQPVFEIIAKDDIKPLHLAMY